MVGHGLAAIGRAGVPGARGGVRRRSRSPALEEDRMRRQLLVALAFGLLLAPARAEDKAAKGDKETIQGTWAIVSGERDGQPIPEEAIKTIKLVFAGDKFTLDHDGQKSEGTVKLAPDKKPKEMDIDTGGQTIKAIYQLEGDTLKIAHGPPGEARPKEFPKKEGSGLTVATLKRQKS
jgi:uncharacterized protein (TIGR03067 family)